MNIIRADKRHYNDSGWLKTYWLFSFDTYHDPDNTNFGILRVFNDDVIAPHTGFGTHPHREMEIVTIVLSGEVSHRDSMGNNTVIKAGEIQRMSAGTGITHSEYNNGDTPLHLYQIWLLPAKRGITPSYEQRTFLDPQHPNTLIPLVSGNSIANTLSINCNADIYRLELKTGAQTKYESNGRKVFIYLASGSVDINGTELNKNDQGRIEGEDTIFLTGKEDSDLIIISVG